MDRQEATAAEAAGNANAELSALSSDAILLEASNCPLCKLIPSICTDTAHCAILGCSSCARNNINTMSSGSSSSKGRRHHCRRIRALLTLTDNGEDPKNRIFFFKQDPILCDRCQTGTCTNQRHKKSIAEHAASVIRYRHLESSSDDDDDNGDNKDEHGEQEEEEYGDTANDDDEIKANVKANVKAKTRKNKTRMNRKGTRHKEEFVSKATELRRKQWGLTRPKSMEKLQMQQQEQQQLLLLQQQQQQQQKTSKKAQPQNPSKTVGDTAAAKPADGPKKGRQFDIAGMDKVSQGMQSESTRKRRRSFSEEIPSQLQLQQQQQQKRPSRNPGHGQATVSRPTTTATTTTTTTTAAAAAATATTTTTDMTATMISATPAAAAAAAADHRRDSHKLASEQSRQDNDAAANVHDVLPRLPFTGTVMDSFFFAAGGGQILELGEDDDGDDADDAADDDGGGGGDDNDNDNDDQEAGRIDRR